MAASTCSSTSSTGADAGLVDKSAIDQLKPNSGMRAVIAAALVKFQLSDPDPARRMEALTALERDANESHLGPLRESIDSEEDPVLKARKIRLERLITIRFGTDAVRRAEAIRSFAGDLGVDARGALNPLVATKPGFAEEIPAGVNVARTLTPGKSVDLDTAYGMLVDAGKAPLVVSTEARKQALIAHIADGKVGGVPVADLDTQEARDKAYMALVAGGDVPPLITTEMKQAEVDKYKFYEAYAESDPTVTTAAEETLSSISLQVGVNRFLDLALDGISLASIYFLAAIGLAITFGVMGVINMAHGEFIMIGAYTGYVVQQFVPNYTASILLALPLAFVVAFMAGVRHGATGDPASGAPAAGNAAGHFRHLDRIAADRQEHFRHPGAASHIAVMARRRLGAQRRGLDQLHPHRHLRAGHGVPGAAAVHPQPHAAGS